MTEHKFSQSSLQNLDGVHADLVKVCHKALELSAFDFGITEGLRSQRRQNELVAAGKSWTTDSRHITGHAIDFAVYVDGKITWEIGYYRKVVQAFMTAAIMLGVQIESGALWRTVVDGPHIELHRGFYL